MFFLIEAANTNPREPQYVDATSFRFSWTGAMAKARRFSTSDEAVAWLQRRHHSSCGTRVRAFVE